VDQLIRAWRRSSHPIYLILIAVLIRVVTIAALFMRDSGIDAPQQQALLDSLSIAKGQMAKAQQDAQTAQQEANNAKTEAADARNEARLAQQQFDSIRNIQALSKAERQQWEATRDLALNKMNQLLDARYRLAADSIEKSPYIQFAFLNVSMYTADALKIKAQAVSSVEDQTIKSIISSSFDASHSNNFNTLDAEAKSKPSLYTIELDKDEFIFYQSLLEKRMPYRKYDPTKDSRNKDKPTE
jgi:hypothetical protein